MNNLNIFFWILVVLLLGICINAEFKIVKLDIHDTTKILMLMCILLILYKQKTAEGFSNYKYLRTSDDANNNLEPPERNSFNDKALFSYDNIDVVNDSFNPADKDPCKVDRQGIRHCENKSLGEFHNSDNNSQLDEKINSPYVDGDGPKKSRFMFNYNQCSPECCPSTYSCSGGCVCTTKKQRNFLQNRGGNRTQV